MELGAMKADYIFVFIFIKHALIFCNLQKSTRLSRSECSWNKHSSLVTRPRGRLQHTVNNEVLLLQRVVLTSIIYSVR